jgi:hypothetical protein
MRLIAVLTLLMCFALPAIGQDASSRIATTDSDAQDTAIANRISDILSVLGDYDDVAIDDQEGVVTFDGTVTTA